MASRAHNFIVQMIGIAMQNRGYTIVSLDGDSTKISDLNYKIPPTLKRHRPDLLGINRENGKICIGEAKTIGDITSKRTKEEFADFSSIISSTNQKVELIIGIPLVAEGKMNKILYELDLTENKNIFILKVPDEVLPK